MNTAIILLLLIVVIYALMNQMMWLALGAGVAMILASGGGIGKRAEHSVNKNFIQDYDDTQWASDTQTLQVLNWPGWSGKRWWEVDEVAHGWGMGRLAGMIK